MLLALLRRLQVILWCAGALLCGFAIGTYLETHLFQAAESRRLEEVLRAEIPRKPAEPPPTTLRRPAIHKAGSLVGRIEIPRLGLSAIVLEGSDTRTLSLGVGRIPHTSEPGEPGNVAIGGHRDTFFRPLSGVRNGDRIKMITPGGSYIYAVDWTAVVNPADTSVLKTTTRRSLTLVTCYPFHYVGPAPKRFIVRAHQLEASEGAESSD